MKKAIIIQSIIFGIVTSAIAQKIDTIENVKLTLNNVIELAIEQSPSMKYFQNRNVNYYWRWKNFKANFRPQLGLSGNLPDYRITNEPVQQPDGSIQFKQISQLSTTADLALRQIIPQTGTTIYGASSLYRVQDYNNETMVPLFILDSYNPFLPIITGNGRVKLSH